MTEDKKTAAEAKSNADEIKDVDATQGGPRGNVHSEPDQPPNFEAPPPLDH